MTDERSTTRELFWQIVLAVVGYLAVRRGEIVLAWFGALMLAIVVYRFARRLRVKPPALKTFASLFLAGLTFVLAMFVLRSAGETPPAPPPTLTPTPDAMAIVNSFYDSRTLVWVNPAKENGEGTEWAFGVGCYGKHSAQNVMVHALDNTTGLNSAKLVIAGVAINPLPIGGFREIGSDPRSWFKYRAADPYDQHLTFLIRDASGARTEQVLRIFRDRRPRREPWQFASIVRDEQTGEVLIGCRDKIVDLPSSQPVPPLPECMGEGMLFRPALAVPERTQHWKRPTPSS